MNDVSRSFKVYSMLAWAGLLLALALWALESRAASLFKYQLTSSDAGQTNVGALLTNQTYSILCDTPAVFQTSTDAGMVLDVTKDRPAPARRRFDNGAIAEPIPMPLVFTSGPHTKIAALSLDAGNPACNVYFETSNTH